MATVVTYDGVRVPSLTDLDARKYAVYFDDFVADLGNDTVTQATAGTGSHDAASLADGGIYRINAASDTDGQGVNIQFKNFTVTPAAGKSIWFECGLKFIDEAAVDLFIGLSDINTTIITTSDTDPDTVGFMSFEDAQIDTTSRDASDAKKNLDVGTVTLNSFTRFSIAIDGLDKISYYINGALVATATTNIPTGPMVPSIVLQACEASAAQPEIYLDYLFAAVER
jgi:hypothetical protein